MRILMAFIAVIGWFSLGLQLYILISNAPENGLSIREAVFNFFSYFTILTNLLVAASLSIQLISPLSSTGLFFSNPAVRTAIAVYIVIVGIVYSVALRHIWNPKGLQMVADRLLHDAIPLLYFIFWIFCTPRKVLQYRNAIRWLIYPVVYLVFALIKGLTTKWYAYPFINISELGVGKVTINCLFVAVAFLIISFLFILINRSLKTKI